MEIVISELDFISCHLYSIKKTKEFVNVPGFGPSLQKLAEKLVLICGNEDCSAEIDFTFWDSTSVQSYECEHCGSVTRFEEDVDIDFFLDLV